MKNMRVKMKLIVGFLLVASLAAIVGVVGIVGMAQLETADTALYDLNLVAVRAMGNMKSATSSIRMHLRTLVLYDADHPRFKDSEQKIDEITREFESYMNNYQVTITETDDQEKFNQIKALYKDYMLNKTIPEVKSAAELNDSAGALSALDETSEQIQQLDNLIDESVAYNSDLASASVKNNTKLFETMTAIAVIVIVIAVAIAVILGLYIAGLISKPLVLLNAFMKKAGTTGDISLSPEDEEIIGKYSMIKDEVGQCIDSTGIFVKHLAVISEELELVASGDLTVSIEMLSEKDTMGVSMQKMVDSLNSLFTDIRAASDQVSSGSGQVSQGAQGLASGSSEQAASIEELSASLAELQDKTNHNAEDSTKAQEANNKTSKGLDESIRSMGQMLEAMKEIDESSSSITKVIKVIDDIAFQTNILALNAAVEAARAGQHGKGFAVVADEVRNLAAKSAEAAKETSLLIEGSTERVKEGNEIVAKTNANLEAAVGNAKESTRLIEQVAAASLGQAKSISEINQGMDQISTVVQANSATAEQSAAAAEEMSAQAVVMNEIVAKFKLRQSGYKGGGMTTQSGVKERAESTGFAISGSKY